MTSRDAASQSPWRKCLLLFSAFVALMFNSSLCYHVGILNIAILDEYPFHLVSSSWLLSIYGSMFALAAPLGSLLIYLFNCRTCTVVAGLISLIGYVLASVSDSFPMLFFTLVIAATGHGLSQTGISLYMTYTFPDRVALVNGLCLAGSGMGSFLHPVLLQALRDKFGFRGALLIIGAVASHACVSGLLFTPTKYETQTAVSKSTSFVSGFLTDLSSKLRLFKKPVYAFFVLAVFAYAISHLVIIVYLPDYVKMTLGISNQEASLAASFVGFGSVVSRLFNSFAASDKRIGALLLFIGMNGIGAVLTFMSKVILQNLISVFVFSFLIGVYTVATYSLITPIVVDILGVHQANSGYGFVMLVCGIGGVVGPPFAAFLLQKFGFDIILTFCGILFISSAVLGMLTALTKRDNSDESPTEDENENKDEDANVCLKTKEEQHSDSLDVIIETESSHFILSQ